MNNFEISEETKSNITDSINDLVRAGIEANIIDEYHLNKWLDAYYSKENK